MTLVPTPKPLQLFRQLDRGEEEIDLTDTPLDQVFTNDIIRCRISGTLPPLPNLKLLNFVESMLVETVARGVDFSECDFKDSVLNRSRFEDCTFSQGVFSTTTLFSCTFTRCTFYNTHFSSTELRSTYFDECDLSNLLITSSKLVACNFKNCRTTNKLVEMSTVDAETRFQNTDIQLSTITSNFGFRSNSLDGGHVRSARSRETHRNLTRDGIADALADPRLSPIEKLRVEFFLNADLTGGSQYLDDSLDFRRWARVYRNPGSFVQLLDTFADFILRGYDDNILTFQPILLLHDVTSKLIQQLPTTEPTHRIALSIGGTHLLLARAVEEFLAILDDLSVPATDAALTFLVTGPNEIAYYESELSRWIGDRQIVVRDLRVRNSPLELHLSAQQGAALLGLLAAFLSSRTKIELIRLKQRRSRTAIAEGRAASRSATPSVQAPVLSVAAGFTGGEDRRYGLQVRSLLPGSLLLELKLDFGTALAGKLRKVIVDLLS